MTPADVQALEELVYEMRREVSPSELSPFARAAGSRTVLEWANRVEAHLQALEALRDEMREWGQHVVDGVWVPHGCTPNSKPRQWANRLDVLLHGAGGLQHEPGCPAIADDESDYEHLADAGTCVCSLSKRKHQP